MPFGELINNIYDEENFSTSSGFIFQLRRNATVMNQFRKRKELEVLILLED
jgi:hypothetical protein